MQSGATRMRKRDSALPLDRPLSEREPHATAPGPQFAHDFTRVPVQTKLKINTPGDSFEQEADHVADEMSSSSCKCAGKCSTCSSKQVQRKSDAPSLGSAEVDPILNAPGRPLDPAARSFMEPFFGHDFSRVRVHTDSHAAASADSLDANAYTVGHHLVFGPNQYRPHTPDGRRLLAHELTHVMQQSAAGPMIQRDDKDKPPPRSIPKGPAEKSPKLTVKEADPKKKPCACLVFMHHDEKNARAAAEAMHAACAYNLAIVDPPGLREIDIMNVGLRDPNELFPRHIFRECVDNDKKCQDEMDKRKSSTKRGESLEFVQRQFFMAIKKCSNGFALPIVALHNNVITDTAAYRKAQTDLPGDLTSVDAELGKTGLSKKKRETLEEKKAKLEKKQNFLAKIKGKTFVDTPPADGQLPENTQLYSELEQDLLDAFPELVSPRSDKATEEKRKPTWKKKIESPKKGLLAGGMTNIFKWCQAHDNSVCHVGDPEHPDNVVWVTKEADFKALEGTKANVVLQTRVSPGESETDLSSMFVGNLDEDWKDRVAREPRHPMPADFWEALEESVKIGERAIAKERQTIAKREAVRFVNVETGQSKKDAAERVEGYRTVKSILKPLGLHCCEEEEDRRVETALQ